MEIVDESDSHIDMQQRARELWKLRTDSTTFATDKEKKTVIAV
jgi:hypothetical protein